MLQETIKKLEHLIETSNNMVPERREELIKLVSELKQELAELEKHEKEHAQSIAHFAKLTAHESLRDEKDEELIQISAKGLRTSVRKFEASHPNLTRVIQSICVAFGV